MAEPDFYLNEEQRALQRTLREFVAKEIAPIAARCDAEERFPVELFKRMGDLGYLGVRFPEEFDGAGGSNLDYAILCEELAYGSGGIALGIYVHMALACAALEAFASEEMKKEWLPPALRGEKIGAWGFAEAGAGSDAASIATRAVAEGDEYVLNGSKLFITNGPIADFVVVVASTAPGQGLKGLSLFLVERDRPGFRVGGVLSKLGV
ncbi:MAG: acyl-CoA dehydrogenase family protein, partial [Deltaproteobacteria bacterium]|nr:acyl-CoA dehydrogenase family protein [Deltaproteobacteria bacterium]